MDTLKISNNKVKKYFYLVLGFLFLGLGIIGIFLPVMPTTIFIILATGCFMQSSEKYYKWIINNKYFGRIVYNYRTFKGIEAKTRTKSLVFLWLTLIISLFLVKILWVQILLICVGIGVTIHLYALHTLTDEEIKRINNDYYQ